MSLKLVMIVAG